MRIFSASGFTLIELLVVLSIIAILIGVAIPNIISSQKRAYDAAALNCAQTLQRAVQIYRIDHPRTSEVPATSELYGTSEKDEFYSTGGCSKLPDGSQVLGNEAPDGAYEFKVRHALGRQTYIISPVGIKSSRT